MKSLKRLFLIKLINLNDFKEIFKYLDSISLKNELDWHLAIYKESETFHLYSPIHSNFSHTYDKWTQTKQNLRTWIPPNDYSSAENFLVNFADDLYGVSENEKHLILEFDFKKHPTLSSHEIFFGFLIFHLVKSSIPNIKIKEYLVKLNGDFLDDILECLYLHHVSLNFPINSLSQKVIKNFTKKEKTNRIIDIVHGFVPIEKELT